MSRLIIRFVNCRSLNVLVDRLTVLAAILCDVRRLRQLVMFVGFRLYHHFYIASSVK